MTTPSITITSVDQGLHFREGAWQPVPPSSGLPGHDLFAKWRSLHGGSSEGLQVVSIGNSALEIHVSPTRGCGILSAQAGQLPVAWQSPVSRPMHPDRVNLLDRSGLGWLHGFNELLCRCGLEVNGPPVEEDGRLFTLHGRISNTPAHDVRLFFNHSSTVPSLELTGVMEESSMFGPKWELRSTFRIEPGSARVCIRDEFTNHGGTSAPLSLLYHWNLGAPILETGGLYALPFAQVAPRDATAALGVNRMFEYEAPQAARPEEAFYFEPLADDYGWSLGLAHNAAVDAAMIVRFRVDTLPRFVVWKNSQAEADGCVTGLEPAVNFPNPRAFERAHGRHPLIEPGQTYTTEMVLEIAQGKPAVAAALAEVNAIQRQATPITHASPKPGWSPQG